MMITRLWLLYRIKFNENMKSIIKTIVLTIIMSILILFLYFILSLIKIEKEYVAMK